MKFACDLDNLENTNTKAKQRIIELEDEIAAMQNSLGDQETLAEMDGLRQAQQAGASVFNIASNDEEPEDEDDQENPFTNERGRPRTREQRQQDGGAGLRGTDGWDELFCEPCSPEVGRETENSEQPDMNFFPSGLPPKTPEVSSQRPIVAGREASLPARAGETTLWERWSFTFPKWQCSR